MNFVKTKINVNSDVPCLVNTANESELPSLAIFAYSSKKHVVLHYSDGTLCFLLTNSGHFSSSAAFSWSKWEQYLLELIAWFSRRRS